MYAIKYLFLSAYFNEHPKKNEPSVFNFFKHGKLHLKNGNKKKNR